MGKIVVVNSITLDGVTQGLGRPDEDTRGGFRYGGWGTSYLDQVMGQTMGEDMATASAILLGRNTYEQMYAYWPHQKDNPYAEKLTQTRKYVVSTTMTEPPWDNTTIISIDVPDRIRELRERETGAVTVLGSAVLVQSLISNGLVDEYRLLIHPLVLGQGKRLFPDNGPHLSLRLSDSIVTTTGVIIATYTPVAHFDKTTET